jgi:membrane-associated PAP2 superfamily phosphatase
MAKVDRWGVLFSLLAALLSVTLIKAFSHTSCPWDLQTFGGTAPYVSHWNVWLDDGGGGHCFPAGHASTGFAFIAVYFGLRQAGVLGARKYLLMAVLAGFVLGLSQQMRGAHFMSHTLWTAWLCWTVGGISHHLYQMLQSKVNLKS